MLILKSKANFVLLANSIQTLSSNEADNAVNSTDCLVNAYPLKGGLSVAGSKCYSSFKQQRLRTLSRRRENTTDDNGTLVVSSLTEERRQQLT